MQQQLKFIENPLNCVTHAESAGANTSNQAIGNNTVPAQRRRMYTTSTSALSAVSATVTTTNEYLMNVDVELCFTALEFILSLLASQSLLALKDVTLSQREKQLIKRELSTELLVFHDFVKKRVLPEVARDNPLQRKKHGCTTMISSKDSSDDLSKQQHSSGGRKSVSNSDRMRINVMRKLHLNQKSPSPPTTTATPFNMTHQYSPIASTSGGFAQRDDRLDLPSSTPAQPNFRRSLNDDDQTDDQDQGDMQMYFDAEDPAFCELSFVQLVDEDYLHFLSNLFGYICHTEKIN